jgi:hypothetical protein
MPLSKYAILLAPFYYLKILKKTLNAKLFAVVFVKSVLLTALVAFEYRDASTRAVLALARE